MTDDHDIQLGPEGAVLLGGPLTFETVPAIYRAAASSLPGSGQAATIDLADVTSADSAGLALLLEWQAQSIATQSRLRIINAPDGLLSLARLADSVELLQLSGRPESA